VSSLLQPRDCKVSDRLVKKEKLNVSEAKVTKENQNVETLNSTSKHVEAYTFASDKTTKSQGASLDTLKHLQRSKPLSGRNQRMKAERAKDTPGQELRRKLKPGSETKPDAGRKQNTEDRVKRTLLGK